MFEIKIWRLFSSVLKKNQQWRQSLFMWLSCKLKLCLRVFWFTVHLLGFFAETHNYCVKTGVLRLFLVITFWILSYTFFSHGCKSCPKWRIFTKFQTHQISTTQFLRLLKFWYVPKITFSCERMKWECNIFDFFSSDLILF